MNIDFSFVVQIASIITALGIILQFTKAGKKYIFSDIYKALEKNRNMILENRVANLRIEILTMIHHCPERVSTIEQLFKEYKDLGGNHYIEAVMNAWRKEYAEDVVKNRITRGK